MNWPADVYSTTIIHSLVPFCVSIGIHHLSHNNLYPIVVAKKGSFLIHIVHIFWPECILLQDIAEFLEVVFDQGGVAHKSLLVVQIHFKFGRICRVMIEKAS